MGRSSGRILLVLAAALVPACGAGSGGGSGPPCNEPRVLACIPSKTSAGIASPATILTSGLSVTAAQVELIGPAGQTVPLTFSSPVSSNRIESTIPSALAAGTWDIRVTDAAGCPGILVSGLTISNTISLPAFTLTPSVVSTGRRTPVRIDGGGFLNGLRSYASPTAGGSASLLESTVFINSTLATTVIPQSLPVGTYDIYIVNTDGSVGALPNGLTIVPDPPPQVTSLNPDRWTPGSTAVPVTVVGTNFRGPTVSLDCRAPGGGLTQLAPTMGATTTSTAQFSVDTTALTTGTVCIVKLTNSDGTSTDHSSALVVGSSENWLGTTTAASTLGTARRAPAVAVGRPTGDSAYLYAIGGDNGLESGALDTVETAMLNRFGDVGSWITQRYRMPVAKTLAQAAQVGRFIYVIGGNNGVGPTNTGYRSQILDPDAAPVISGDVQSTTAGPGLAAGLWSYRVAALMGPADESNPGGETLPSAPLVTQVSQSSLFQISFSWIPVAGAASYIVYLMGCVRDRMFHYIVGGTTGVSAATNTIEVATR